MPFERATHRAAELSIQRLGVQLEPATCSTGRSAAIGLIFSLNPFLALAYVARDESPSKLDRQTEHPVLARPLGWSIAQASDADAARQQSFPGVGPPESRSRFR